jgi:hypothetical protein
LFLFVIRNLVGTVCLDIIKMPAFLQIIADDFFSLHSPRRRALHTYDPADLQTNTSAANQAVAAEPAKAQPKDCENKDATVQSRQIEDAIAKGLLVDLPPSNSLRSPGKAENGGETDCCSPVSVQSEGSNGHGRRNLIDLDEWNDKEFIQDGAGGDDDDSDDDLL